MTPLNYIPPVNCTISITAMFDAQATSGVDFGGASYGFVYVTQNGIKTTGTQQPLGLSRLRYGIQYQFQVVAGIPLVAGLDFFTGTSQGVTVWNADVKYEVIKR